MNANVLRWLLIGLAVLFWIIDAALTGHLFTSTADWGWLLPGGLASFGLSFLIP